MNKKIKLFLQGKGFNVEKNIGYGKIDNYEVNFCYSSFNNRTPVIFHISC